MGQYEQLESQADASWMYEFSPMVFPCGLKFHLDLVDLFLPTEKIWGVEEENGEWGICMNILLKEGYL